MMGLLVGIVMILCVWAVASTVVWGALVIWHFFRREDQ